MNALKSLTIALALTGCIQKTTKAAIGDGGDTGTDDGGDTDGGTSGDGGTDTTPTTPSCQEDAELHGYGFGEWEVCMASWLNTTGRAAGMYGDGYGSETGWQYAVALGEESEDFDAHTFGVRAFGSGSAFRASFGSADEDTLALLGWWDLSGLPASEYIVEFQECDLETGEIVTKYNLCYGMSEAGEVFPGDCSLTYVPPEDCQTHDSGDGGSDGDGGSSDGGSGDGGDTDTGDDGSSGDGGSSSGSGSRTSETLSVVVDSSSVTGTRTLSAFNRTTWVGDWLPSYCDSSSSDTTLTCTVSVMGGDILQINGTRSGGWLVEYGPTDSISSITIGGVSHSIGTSSDSDCVYTSNGVGGYDLYCTVLL